jgi:hypothetical protein
MATLAYQQQISCAYAERVHNPKTTAGVREIPLGEDVVAILKRRRITFTGAQREGRGAREAASGLRVEGRHPCPSETPSPRQSSSSGSRRLGGPGTRCGTKSA